MISKVQFHKTVTLYRPVQKELQKVISLLRKAIKRDGICYCCNSPDSLLGQLEEVDYGFDQLIENLEEDFSEEEIA